MSKKKIVFIILAVVFGVANTVLYLIFKQQYLDVLKQAYDLLNEPLPIVGITAASLLIFLWQVIKAAKFGEGRINKIERKYQEKSDADDAKIEKQNKVIKLQDAKIAKLENHLIKVCEVMPNKKVKAVGAEVKKESFYGEERINNETKAD